MHKLRSFPEFFCFDPIHQYYSNTIQYSANPYNKAVSSLIDVEPKTDAETDCLPLFTTIHTCIR